MAEFEALMSNLQPAAPDSPATPESGASPDGGSTILQHLKAVHELQSTLAVEQREENVLQAGTTAVIELVGLDCGVALVDPSGGHEALRFGLHRGRRMAQHEIEVLARTLDKEILEVRSGKTTRVVLATEAGSGPEVRGEPPGAIQSRDIGSVLVLGLGGVGRRDGVMILARRNASCFGVAELALAELLALQVSAQYERVRRKGEANRLQEEARSVNRILQERNKELEALQAISDSGGASIDANARLLAVLQTAIQVTEHAGGVLYLIDTDDSGVDTLRPVHAIGESAFMDEIKKQALRRGEGSAGRVWESGDSIVENGVGHDPQSAESRMLRRAGYHRMIWQPLRGRGRVTGVLLLLDHEEADYSSATTHLVNLVAANVATTIHDVRLLDDVMGHNLELENRHGRLQSEFVKCGEQLEGIRGVIAAADGSGYGDCRLEGFLPGAVAMLHRQAGALFRIDAETGRLRLRFQHGFPPETHRELEQDPGMLLECCERNEPTTLNLAGPEGDRPAWISHAPYRSVTLVPFGAHGKATGLLAFAGHEDASVDEERPEVLSAMAALAGLISSGNAAPAVAGATMPEPPTAPQAENQPGFHDRLVQTQKMESIGTLAGGIAHHFNNILACILGYASHIKSMVPADGEIYAKATIIEGQTERAAELTNQLRAFARAGTGTRAPVDLNDVLQETVSFLSKSIDPAIKLEVDCAPDLPATEADAERLRQVFLNVAINARDAMPDGGQINFETRLVHHDEPASETMPDLRPGDYLVVKISDTGPGMAPEVVERACEPFFTSRPVGEGAGLGLSVAYGVVKSHGGHLAISSAPGIGTAVTIYLPSSGRQLRSKMARHKSGGETASPAQSPPEDETGGSPAVTSEAEDVAASAAARAAVASDDREAVAPDVMPVAPSTASESVESTGPAAEKSWEPVESTGPATEKSWEPVERTGPAAKVSSEPVEPTGSAAEESSEPGASGTGPFLMVVDDESSLRAMAADLLGDAGYRVETARDGVQALDLYRQHWGEIDLVILDMVMPRLGGLETFRRIRGMNREARVLIYSGYDRNEQARQAVQEGAVGMLAKPFAKSDLLEWVRKSLAPN